MSKNRQRSSGGSVCRECGQPILWAKTKNDKSMPLDPVPTPDGNVAVYTEVTGVRRAHVVSDAAPIQPFEQLHMPHAASCPERAARLRRQGPPKSARDVPRQESLL